MSGTVLREAFDYAFSRLDPTGAHIDPPAVAIYETAIAKGPDGGPHPLLAERWEVSGDGLSWRLRLRPGLRFHSGARCDAAAVVDAYLHLRDHSFEHRRLWYWDPVADVTAEDATTLRFTLHHPYARLPALLWGTHTAVYAEAARAAAPACFGYSAADGTGPFRLVSWSPERVVAERWEEYRGPSAGFLSGRPAALDRIEWVAIGDAHERLAALERGAIDCLHGPPLDEVAALRADSRFVVTEHRQSSNFYLALDWRHRELGFDDLRVRGAISRALDRDRIVAVALGGHGAATLGPLPPGGEFHDAAVDAERRPALAAAGARLDAAGWVQEGAGDVRVRDGQALACSCVTQDDPVFRRVMEEVRRQLVPLGVRLEPHYERPFADFYAACAAGPPATLSKWLWQDPLDAVIGFSSSSTAPFPNWQHASVPALDAAYAAWLRAGTPQELAATARVAQQRFAEQLPYIPLATPNDVFVHRAGVRGWEPYAANLYPFYQGVTVES